MKGRKMYKCDLCEKEAVISIRDFIGYADEMMEHYQPIPITLLFCEEHKRKSYVYDPITSEILKEL
jgi:hypothetical protein